MAKDAGPGEALFADPSQASTTVSFTDPGIYVLELSASDGMYAAGDRINLRVALPCEAENPPGLAAWWPWNGRLLEAMQGLPTLPRRHSVDYSDGAVSSGLVFDGSLDGLFVERAPALDVGAGGGFGIEYWVRPSRVISEERIVEWRDAAGNRNGVSLAHWGSSQLILRIVDAGGAISSATSGTGLVAANQWRHIAVTYDHDVGLVTFYRNGALYSQQTITKRVPETSLDLYIGFRHPNLNHFQGVLDELSLYNRALEAAEVAEIYHLGGAGKCPVDPTSGVATAPDDSVEIMAASQDSGYTLGPLPAPLMASSLESSDDADASDGPAGVEMQATPAGGDGEQWVFQEGLELVLVFDAPDGPPEGSMVLRFLGDDLVEIVAAGQLGIYTYTATTDTGAMLELILSHQVDSPESDQFQYYKLLLEYKTGDEGNFEGWLVLDEGNPQRRGGLFSWR